MSNKVNRPDLAAVPARFEEFIGQIVAPSFYVRQKAGNLYYDDVSAEATGQTNRSLSAAPSATDIAGASVAFSTAEVIKRMTVDASEVALLGGLPQAQVRAAQKSKRAVWNIIEAAIAHQVMDHAGTSTDILADPLGAVHTGYVAVKDAAPESKVIAVMSSTVFKRIQLYTDVKAVMAFTGVAGAALINSRGISKEIMAQILGVDGVEVGNDAIWRGSAVTNKDALALVAVGDGSGDPLMAKMAFSNVMYAFDENNQWFNVETHESEDLRAQVVDGFCYYTLKQLNTELSYVLTGFDAGNTVVTT